MTIRNLEALFAPKSLAVIGVPERPGSLGRIVLANVLHAGFAGPVWLVDRHGNAIDGREVSPDVASLPGVPDLAVICTPARGIPELIEQLGQKGTRAAIVISAGLKEPMAEGGPTIEQLVLDAARPHLLRVLGPNCIGLLVPRIRLNASFAPGDAQPGSLAFVTQSGALATAMLDWGAGRGIGFSHFVSLGDSADVDFGDVLDYLGGDPHTSAILMYAESVKHARKFMSAARAAARAKPVILVKAGRAPEGAKAAASHTGALAGSDAVFDAAVERAGMLRVDTLEALFDAAETLAHPRAWHGERLAIVTNGGGAGVLAADALALGHGRLAQLSAATLARLDSMLPPTWSHGNPVDIIGDAPVERYTQALQVLLDAPEVDGVLFMHAPTAIVPAADIAGACAPLVKKASKPVLSCWVGGPAAGGGFKVFTQNGLPCYRTPERAVSAWLQLQDYHRHQQALLQLPEARPEGVSPDRAAARLLLQQALAEGREWLDEAHSKQLLAAYGIPTVQTVIAADAEAAAQAADGMGYPVAVKVLSPQVLHKSDVGGVVLDLQSAAEVRQAAARILERVTAKVPGAQVAFTVQQMARRPGAHELILGIASDPAFGPVLLFGHGGTAVELRNDRAVGLPPLNAQLAESLVKRTRIASLLAGYRDRPAIRHAALVDALLQVSQMACDLPELAELDINPLLADADGVLALDARIRVRQPQPGEGSRLALRPYPAALEEHCIVAGRELFLRPIRPDDGDRLAAFYADAAPEDMRLRFFHARHGVTPAELARFCQIDYEREMALVALEGDRIVGEARAICDPDNASAEFATQVAGDWQHKGLGGKLMARMLAYLRSRGTGEVVAYTLQENQHMVALGREAGFSAEAGPEDLVTLRLRLA